ncbi:hypothetical protein DXC51_10940 [Eisenbergiella massiliensis]|uniref:Uncharacterized protein n=1 Tax=Eisenbergiella massiliensis TaxID=1720294 RepID=A0A3E3I5X2_9FIRM|nr:hypothetical protein DXC51_10940 [Eisenbergiella massiliensis]
MQAWILGSLLAGIKKDRIVPAHPPSRRRRRAGFLPPCGQEMQSVFFHSKFTAGVSSVQMKHCL